MVEKEDDEFEIEIEKSGETTRIRISGVSKSRFDEAYRLATNLTHWIEELNGEIEEEQRLNFMNMQVNHLWTEKDALWKLDESISDPSYRIALSLLRTHPECKQQVEIRNETGVPKTTISDNLGGKVDSTINYFYKCEKGHRLSDVKLQLIHNEIIPSILTLRDES